MTPRNRHLPKRSSKRGNVILTALLIGTVLGFTALSVDIGLVRVARTQLQTAVDAAAVSGAQELDGTAAGIASARARAIEYGAYNAVLTHAVQLTNADVDVGAYDAKTGVFDSYGAGDSAFAVNAVRINKSGADVVPVLSHFVFGTNSLQVRATSLAQRPLDAGPLGRTDCFLPFAIPDCHLAGLAAGKNPAPFMFRFSPSPKDSIAWGDPDHNPNTNDTRDQLDGQCANGDVAVGDPLYVNEGNHTSALKELGDILNKKTTQTTTPWNTSLYGAMPARGGSSANNASKSSVTSANWGNTLQGVVALVDAGTNCNNVSFTGSKPITGFAWAVVYDVADSGNTKNVFMLLDVTSPHKTWGDVSETAKGTNVTGVGDASLGGK